MKKNVPIDPKTLAGNNWIKNKFNLTDSVSYSTDAATFDNEIDGVAFYISQLSYLEQQIYATKYATITFREDIPVMAGVPETAQTVNYRSYDGVAMSKFIGASAKDLPKISLTAKMSVIKIGYGGNQMDYTIEELRTSAILGMPIDTHQFELGFRSSQEHSQEVAYFGDTERDMYGLFNHPNVPKGNADKPVDSMTGQELFNMVNDAIFQVATDSKFSHLPNTVLVSPSVFKAMNSTFMTQIAEKNALKYFKENNLYTQQTGSAITILPRLALEASYLAERGVKNDNKDRIMVYEKNQQNLTTVANMPYRTIAPQYVGLSIIVPAEYKASGTEFRYPLSAKYVDMA